MKNKWLVIGIIGVVAACSKSNPKVNLVDAGSNSLIDAPPIAACNVLLGTGCNVGERCTWVHSTEPTPDAPALGANACVPDTGTVATGGACMYGAAGDTGFDNCMKGNICVHKTCKLICDNNGGTGPACPTNAACVTYDSLFANSGATTTPAGACDPTCNPITDNDFDGSGTQFTRTGTSCGSDPVTACYGNISSTHTTFFTCSTPVTGTETLTHRSPVPMAKQFLNACMSGYHLGEFYADDSGAKVIDCFAYCTPGESDTAVTGGGTPNGVAPHRCNNNDALGNFSGGTPTGANPVSNGEHCWFSWYFEIDSAKGWHKSPTSDTVGICIDHTKYHWDSNASGAIDPADMTFPNCASLPVMGTATTLGAVDIGCVTSTTAGLTPAFGGKSDTARSLMERRLRFGIQVPEFPDYPRASETPSPQ